MGTIKGNYRIIIYNKRKRKERKKRCKLRYFRARQTILKYTKWVSCIFWNYVSCVFFFLLLHFLFISIKIRGSSESKGNERNILGYIGKCFTIIILLHIIHTIREFLLIGKLICHGEHCIYNVWYIWVYFCYANCLPQIYGTPNYE